MNECGEAVPVDAFLDHHFRFRPVDASFMGQPGHDGELPDASAGAADAERAGIADLRAILAQSSEPADVGGRLDRRQIEAQLSVAESTLDTMPRFANPAWYTGEGAFSILSLLLPRSDETPLAAIAARLKSLPDFLADGRARLEGGAAPTAITERARREAAAAAAFLRGDVTLHPDWTPEWETSAHAAAGAFECFAAAIADLPDKPVACGRPHLERLMRDAHGLTIDADAAVARAEAAFDGIGRQLQEEAARLDPSRTWQQQVEELDQFLANSADDVIERCRFWDAEARAAGGALVTPADDYDLDYRWLATCFRTVAQSLYFLPYRSPPAGNAGAGSVYWIAPPGDDREAYRRANPEIAVKLIHSVHHGSIGHHTQNARARVAESRLARLAGTDCALGLGFLSSGTMVEGWACYVQDMVGEAGGFYTAAERLYCLQQQRRNAASVLVDIRLHTGEWSPQEAMAFYRDRANFAPARVAGEVTRNCMLPGTRLMYWLGTEQILDLRRRWRGDVRSFHDTLIGYGHVPVAWAGEEMERAGLLR